ncbi:MAG: sulfur carrier protein ThiS [Treponema sp.]|nr:sulfur carrier protein ThiS [Treponema sp.]
MKPFFSAVFEENVMIRVNGKDLSLSGERDLSEFLLSQGYQEGQVVVELNGVIHSRGNFGALKIRDGDVLEILQFMGGGSR